MAHLFWNQEALIFKKNLLFTQILLNIRGLSKIHFKKKSQITHFFSMIPPCMRVCSLPLLAHNSVSIPGTCQMQFSSQKMTLAPILVFIYLFNLIFIEAY